MSIAYIIDTSFLLGLNKIPRHWSEEQFTEADAKMEKINAENARPLVFITVPILFEYARFLSYIEDDTVRRKHAIKLNTNISTSLSKRKAPWAIHGAEKEFLLKTGDIIALSKRFVGPEGCVYSFADLSIIQLTDQIEKRRKVEILTFEKKLKSYAKK